MKQGVAVYTRARFFFVVVLALIPAAAFAQAQPQNPPQPLTPTPPSAPMPAPTSARTPSPAPRHAATPLVHHAAATPATTEVAPPPAVRPGSVLAEVTLADIGFINGVRLANLGGRQDLFVPLPQDGAVAATGLTLVLDDVSAFEARRNLEVQINDRTATAIALDGKTRDRTVRIPLAKVRPRDGYLKISFLYSGAATLDRCIDVRYVGDSVTVRPETAVEIDVGPVGELDVATTAALMPREVTVALPGRRVTESEVATAVTVARSLIASGRRVAFHRGYEGLGELSRRDESGRWIRGVVLVGPLAEATSVLDAPLAKVAGPIQPFGTLAAVRVGGLPALLVSDGDVVRAGRLFASPLRAATRGVAAAFVGEAAPVDAPTDRATFEQLGVPPAQIDVFGRADLTAIIDIRRLPPETRPTRLLLDVMVAPDGAGAKAVVSAFVNERLLGSTVAATSEATHLDLGLPDGLIGNIADIRVVIQRESAQGDCRFEPQGYPAQILASSALVLASASGAPHDFSDLPPHFARGVKLLLPAADADHPDLVLGLLTEVVQQLSPDVAPLNVSFASSSAPTPNGPFIAVSEGPPAGANPRVRFDRGRVVVADRSGRTLLDLGGFVGGAVAQVVEAGDYPGVWIKPLAANGAAPSPSELRLDHGDVAFIDGNGVALAMSTERDTVVRITYPDQVSWLTVAERFRSWIIAGLWLSATVVLLFILQRMFRRRSAHTGE
jgi:cellulose synthase operon protein B